jgi:type III pantothenate kinase
MLLVVDIGNTHTVFGVLKGQEVLDHWRISSSMVRTEDEIGVLLKNYFQIAGYDFKDIEGVAISSVVPDLSKSYQWMSQKYLKKEALLIDSGLKLGMEIKYKDPKTVGADRLCNAIAGIEKYGKPLIIIDFGTATTFDCIDSSGNYAGGIIAPGIETSIKALHRNAAKLPLVELKFPPSVIGVTTEESIQVGILKGTVHIVEGLIKDIRKELGMDTPVIATGGLANTISVKTKSINHVDSFLSLRGCASIYNRNRN